MRQPPTPLRAMRFAIAAAIVALLAAGLFGAGCGPDQMRIWVCLNPVTGKEDGSVYDSSHFVNGTPDPCHCYDPCGPLKTCPDVEDAGPLPLGCDAGAGDAGDGGH